MDKHVAYEIHVDKTMLSSNILLHILLRDRALKPLLMKFVGNENLQLCEVIFNDTYIQYEINCPLERVGVIYRLEQLMWENTQSLPSESRCG